MLSARKINGDGQRPAHGVGRTVLAGWMAMALLGGAAAADEVELPPSRDATLYENADGLVANGAGSHFFAGRTGGGSRRRGLLHFDLSSAVPAGSTVESATLTLFMSRSLAGARSVGLHPLLAPWGEGTSDAAGEEGSGTAVTFGSATWIHTYYYTLFWDSVGGDFEPTASASTVVGGVGSYGWSSADMLADIQAWVDDADSNFGWLVRGDESATMTAKRFDSRFASGTAPVLALSFTPPADVGACCLASGNCMLASEAACAAASGAYQGGGSMCMSVTCLQPQGACCFGDQSCSILDPAMCAAGQGVYQGDGADCTPMTCALPTGACCFDNGACSDLTVGECQSQLGEFSGEGTSCASETCPAGACCFSGDSCFYLSPDSCSNFGGVYQGDSSTCKPNPCGLTGCQSTADCADLDEDGVRDDGCTFWSCVDTACVSAAIVYADMGGPNGGCLPDGTSDGNDRFHALNCFSDQDTSGAPEYPCESDPPMAFNVDPAGFRMPCTPDGVCDGNDAFAAINAFSGMSTCSCSGGPAPDGPAGSTQVSFVGEALLSLQVRPVQSRGPRLFAVDIFLDSADAAVRGYQLHLDVTGGRRGSLELRDIVVERRADRLFGESPSWQAFNRGSAQMVAGTDGAGVVVDARSYLATYVYRADHAAVGQFAVRVAQPGAGRSFVFADGAGQALSVRSGPAAVMTIRPRRY